jgi:hypothetical protein
MRTDSGVRAGAVAVAFGSAVLSLPGALTGASTLRTVEAVPRDAQETVQEVERPRVSSKTITTWPGGASLSLDFDDGSTLSVALRNGEVLIDAESVGTFQEEGVLWSSWRSLVARAVTLDGQELTRELVDWRPPPGDAGVDGAAAIRIDEALEAPLSVEPTEVSASASLADSERLTRNEVLTRLLDRPARLDDLSRAVDGVSLDDAVVRVGRDAVVEAGSSLDGTLVVVDGDLDIRGRVSGDVVVVGGTLRSHPGSRVTGSVRLSDARLTLREGEITGSVVEFEAEAAEGEADRLSSELRDEWRHDMRSSGRAEHVESDEGRWSILFSPFRWLWRAVTEIVANLLAVLVIGGAGSVFVLFGRENLEVVAETARRSPARAASVGLAGTFLLLPVWVLGMVALAVSIVGLLALPFWGVLFPVAAALAVTLGYFSVARNVGGWLARRRLPYLTWIRSSNPITLVFGGVIVLMASFVASDLADLFGSALNPVEALLLLVGVVLTAGAALVGFGAVLITRGGRRPEYYRGPETGEL